jgi:hypothetical protein
MKRIGAAFFALALLLLVVSAPPASAAAWRHCGHSIRAHNLSCRKAKRVGSAYLRGTEHFSASPSPFGFSCRERQVGAGEFRVACRRARGRHLEQVRFGFRWG